MSENSSSHGSLNGSASGKYSDHAEENRGTSENLEDQNFEKYQALIGDENNEDNDENFEKESQTENTRSTQGVIRGINQIMINDKDLFNRNEESINENNYDDTGLENTNENEENNSENEENNNEKDDDQISRNDENYDEPEQNQENINYAYDEQDYDESQYEKVHEPRKKSTFSSSRNPRNKSYANNAYNSKFYDEPEFEDVPFSLAPLDPTIQHFIFKDDTEESYNYNSRARQRSVNNYNNYYKKTDRTSIPQTSRIKKSPYFLRPLSIYKVPLTKPTRNPPQAITRGRGLTSHKTRVPNFSEPNLIPSDYIERTAANEQREKATHQERVETFKATHKMPFYEKQYKPSVYDIKVAQFRQENASYRKSLDAQRRRRYRNNREHRDLLQQINDFDKPGRNVKM